MKKIIILSLAFSLAISVLCGAATDKSKITMLLPDIVAKSATTYYVDAVYGDDDNNGLSPETAFATIRKGVHSASDGDTVVVADGTYAGSGNRDIEFRGKAITVCSENGPENCIIDCGGTRPRSGFKFSRGENANSILDGFTMTFGGTGIICYGGSPTIKNCKLIGMAAGMYLQDCNSKITNCIIKDNKGEGNGGIHCYSASPTISNCIISGNVASTYPYFTYGGGIGCVKGSSPTIKDCIISDNAASFGGGIGCSNESNPIIINCTISSNAGDGIFCENSIPTIKSCTISENDWGIYCIDGNLTINDSMVSDNGIGIYCGGSSLRIANSVISGHTYSGVNCYESGVTIDNCIISNNSRPESGGGGGIECSEGTLTAINTTITNNLAGWGGGIFAWGDSTTTIITNCIISDNRAEGEVAYGGGVFYYDGGNHTISNSVISGNKATWGGGIECGGSASIVTNCTIAGNVAENIGGGIFSAWASSVLANCILWGNTASQGKQIAVGYEDPPWESVLTLSFSDVEGGQDEVYSSPNSVLNWGDGNIDTDPCFVEAGYWDVNGIWVGGDHHLLEDSPCIDTGDPNYVPEPNETDLDGKARVTDGDEDGVAMVDMGAYEYMPPIEATMQLTPQTINCKSKGKMVKAHITLPEGFLPEDVDVNAPAVAEPMDVESEYIKVVGGDNGPVNLEIAFDRTAFCAELTEPDEIEITVTGSLTSGQYFYATDTIRITPNRRQITLKLLKKGLNKPHCGK